MIAFDQKIGATGQQLKRAKTEILQINVGKLCNLTCTHCHVNAGPGRKEIITRATIDRILQWLQGTDITTVDLTGGAPEMIPDFRYLIEQLRTMGPHMRIMDRCNLTILLEPDYDGLAEFLAENQVEIVASMPCYCPENVNAQRGEGVFDRSITALQKLNALGYSKDAALPLDLVYNPNGAVLPGCQVELEADYKRELMKHFDITFNRLFTITNLPVARFSSWLKHNGKYEDYMQLLLDAFNPASVEGLMCRNTLSIGWQGEVYDCDFNQQLGMQWCNGSPMFLWDVDNTALEGQAIATGSHCFGCTAGAGSSCGGALVE